MRGLFIIWKKHYLLIHKDPRKISTLSSLTSYRFTDTKKVLKCSTSPSHFLHLAYTLSMVTHESPSKTGSNSAFTSLTSEESIFRISKGRFYARQTHPVLIHCLVSLKTRCLAEILSHQKTLIY